MKVLYIILLTLLFLLLMGLLRLGKRLWKAWLRKNEDKIRRPFAYRGFTFVPASTIDQGVKKGAALLWLLANITVVYTYLSILLGFFQETQNLSHRLTQLLLRVIGPIWNAFWGYLPNLLSIIVICGVSYYYFKIVDAFFNAIAEGKLAFDSFDREWAEPTCNLLKFLSVLFLVVLIFPLLPGSGSPVFQGVSVFLGVLLSLGSSSAVGNVIAGVVLIYNRAFQVGDFIETNGVMGNVVEKGLLVTRIRTIKNVEVTFPNAMILGTMTQNYSKEAQHEGLILNTTVTIGYDVPWRQVYELLLQAAKSTHDILEQPEPFILQKSLNDFFVSYELNAYTRGANRMANIYSALNQHIQDGFNQAGVEMMSPHYTALRDGNASTVVPPTESNSVPV